MAKEVEIVVKGKDEASATFGTVSKSLAKVGEDMLRAGDRITRGVSQPIMKAGMDAVKMAGDFESQMNILGVAVSGAGDDMQAALRDAAISVGADSQLIGIDAAQAADALTTFYKAGLTTADIFGGPEGLNTYLEEGANLSGVFRQAIDLAAASDLDLAQASDLTAIAMKTFPDDLARGAQFADVFVKAADASVMEVSDLGEALTAIGPTAAAMGIPIEDLSAAIAILSERGITGSMAGTALRSMLTNLQRPTKAVKEALADLNVSLYDSTGVLKPFPQIIDEFAAALETGEGSLHGLTEEQRNLYVQQLAGTYGMTAMNTLMEEGTAGWNRMTGQISEASSAEAVAAARTQGFNAAMEQLQGAFQTFMIQAGQPLIDTVLMPMIEKAGDVIDWLLELDPAVLGMATKFGIALAAAGPLITVLGFMVTALGALISPAGLIIAGIVALGAAFVASQGGIGPTIEMLGGIGDIITSRLQPLIEGFQGIWATVWGFVQGIIAEVAPFVEGLIGSMVQFASDTLGQLVTWVTSNMPLIQATIETVLGAVQAVWNVVWPILQTVVSGAWDQIKIVVSTAISVVLGIIQAVMQAITGDWEGAWITIQNVGATIWDGIVALLKNTINTVLGIFGTDLQAVVGFVEKAFGSAQKWIETSISTIETKVSAGFAAVEGAIEPVVSWIEDTVGPVVEGLADIFDAVLGLALRVVSGIFENVLMPQLETSWAVIKDVADALAMALSPAFEAAGKVIEIVGSTIATALQPALETIKKLFGEVADFLKGAWTSAFGDAEKSTRDGLGSALLWLKNSVLDPVKGALDAVQALAGKLGSVFSAAGQIIRGVNLPEWIEPGSPSPLETSLVGITEAFQPLITSIMAFGASLSEAESKGLKNFGEALEEIAGALVQFVSLSKELGSMGTTPIDIGSYFDQLEFIAIDVVDTIQRIQNLFGYDTIKELQNTAKRLTVMFEAVLRDFSTIKAMELPDMDVWSDQIYRICSAVVDVIATLQERFTYEAITDAALWAEAVQGISGFIKPAADMLLDMATYEPIENLQAAVKDLYTRLMEVLPVLFDLSTHFELEGVQIAGEFYAAAGKMFGEVGKGIDLVLRLAEYEEVSSVVTAVMNLADRLYEVVRYLGHLADFFTLEGVQNAAAFYTAASTIFGGVSSGISLIQALAAYVPVGSLVTQILDLGDALEEVLTELILVAGRFDLEGTQLAALFYTAAGTIFSSVGSGMDLLLKLVTWEGVGDLSGAASNLGEAIAQVIEELVEATAYLDVDGTTVAAAFYSGAKTILEAAGGGLDLIRELVDLPDLSTIPGKADVFGEALTYVIGVLQGLSEDVGLAFSEEGLAILGGIGEAVGVITPGINALATLADYPKVLNLEAKMEQFKAQMLSLITKLQELALAYGGDALTDVLVFSEVMATIAGYISTTTEGLMSVLSLVGENVPEGVALFEQAFLLVVSTVRVIALHLELQGIPFAEDFAENCGELKTLVEAGIASVLILGGDTGVGSVAESLLEFENTITGAMRRSAAAVVGLMHELEAIFADMPPIEAAYDAGWRIGDAFVSGLEAALRGDTRADTDYSTPIAPQIGITSNPDIAAAGAAYWAGQGAPGPTYSITIQGNVTSSQLDQLRASLVLLSMR